MQHTKIFIANNGLSAIKFIHSLCNNNIIFYGMVTKEDIDHEYVKHIEVELVPSGPPCYNYENIELVVKVAKQFKVDFIFPGWGHLSECAEFAYEVEKAGIVFLGPNWFSMWVCGNKIASMILAEHLDVNIIPCSIEINTRSVYERIIFNRNRDLEKDVMNKNKNVGINNGGLKNSLETNTKCDLNDDIKKDTNEIDINGRAEKTKHDYIDDDKQFKAVLNTKFTSIYEINELLKNDYKLPDTSNLNLPILFKSINTGGGKGVFKVENRDEIARLKKGNFYAVELRKGGRHIEIQILSDGIDTISLGARDCSTQRRYQKVIETTTHNPIINILEEKAIKLISFTNYKGLATVEFLVFKNEYFFLEINTRLQVEHTVTELEKNINIPLLLFLVCSGISIKRIFGENYKLLPNNCKIGYKDKLDVLLCSGDFIDRKLIDGENEDEFRVVIAVRILAEDNNMLARCGLVKVNQFYSNCKSYFSITNGLIHEYSESQFGHVFVVANNRNTAIDKMINSLRSISIDYIHTPIERIISYLNSKSFREDDINTSTYETFLYADYQKSDDVDDKSHLKNNSNPTINQSFDKKNVMYINNNHPSKHSLFNHNLENIKIQPFVAYSLIKATIQKKYTKLDFTINNTIYNTEIWFIREEEYLVGINCTYKSYIIVQISQNRFLIKDIHNKTTKLTELYDNTLLIDNLQFNIVESIEKSTVIMPKSGRIIKILKKSGTRVEKGEELLEYESMKIREILCAPFGGILVEIENALRNVKLNEIIGRIEGEKSGREKSKFMFQNEEITQNFDCKIEIPKDALKIDCNDLIECKNVLLICLEFKRNINFGLVRVYDFLKTKNYKAEHLIRNRKLLNEQFIEDKCEKEQYGIYNSNTKNETDISDSKRINNEIGVNYIITLLYKISLIANSSETRSILMKILMVLQVKRIEHDIKEQIINFYGDNHLAIQGQYIIFHSDINLIGINIYSDVYSEISVLNFLTVSRLMIYRINVKKVIYEYSIYKGYVEYIVVENGLILERRINGKLDIINNSYTPVVKIENLSNRRKAVNNNTIYYRDMVNLFKIYFNKVTPLKLVTNSNGEYGMEEGESTPIGIVAYKFECCGREVIMIMNDISVENGSFSTDEYIFFYLISKYCLTNKIPRVYIASNSGARIGIFDEGIKIIQDCNLRNKKNKKFYGNKEEVGCKNQDKDDTVFSDGILIHNDTPISIYGNKSTGPENLSYSALIARITQQLYDNGFTLTYVTGMSVGIGAYLARLGHRVIQKNGSSIILTGYKALNKLIQTEIYKSNEDIGGYEIMGSNGVSAVCVDGEVDAVLSIKEWLSFYCTRMNIIDEMKLKFKNNNEKNKIENNILETNKIENDDVVMGDSKPYLVFHNNTINFEFMDIKGGVTTEKTNKKDELQPDNEYKRFDSIKYKLNSGINNANIVEIAKKAHLLNENYNEREILELILEKKEIYFYYTNWAPNVITCRGYINNHPVGIIASEVKTIIKDDECYTQGVMFAETADKIAESIEIFNREEVDLIIICNWKGFSGSAEEMKKGVLKTGSNIVKALSNYKNKIIVYIPPGGELRGGTYVVFDTKINKNIKVIVHPNSEIGILQPTGLLEIKMRDYDKAFAENYCRIHDNVFRMVKNGMVEYCSVKELKEFIVNYFSFSM